MFPWRRVQALGRNGESIPILGETVEAGGAKSLDYRNTIMKFGQEYVCNHLCRFLTFASSFDLNFLAAAELFDLAPVVVPDAHMAYTELRL